MSNTREMIAYFKKQVEDCIDQTGMIPDANDFRYLIDSDEFREVYAHLMNKQLAYGSEGVAQVLMDILNEINL